MTYKYVSPTVQRPSRYHLIGVRLIAAVAMLFRLAAGWLPAEQPEPYLAYVPADKKLDPQWVRSLTAKGERKVYTGDELKYLAMPCGGIGAGELSIRGDGQLATWCLLNEVQFGNADGAQERLGCLEGRDDLRISHLQGLSHGATASTRGAAMPPPITGTRSTAMPLATTATRWMNCSTVTASSWVLTTWSRRSTAGKKTTAT